MKNSKEITTVVFCLIFLFGFSSHISEEAEEHLSENENVLSETAKLELLEKSTPKINIAPIENLSLDPETLKAPFDALKEEPAGGVVKLVGGFEDATRSAKARRSNLITGLDIQVQKNTSIGVAVSKEFVDPKDQRAWNADSKSDEAATIKYKVRF